MHHPQLWGPCKCVVLGTSCRHHGPLLPCTPCSRAHTVAVCGRSLGLVGQIIIPALGFISCVTSSHSWRTEAALADTVDWIGWRISVSTWTVAVPPGKLVRIVEQIKSIQKSRQLTLRDLQSLVGRLLWLTSAWHYLRPLLIPLCKALRRIPTTMVGMDHVTFHSLVQQLDDQLQLTASLTHKHQSLRPGRTWYVLLTPMFKPWTRCGRYTTNPDGCGWVSLTLLHHQIARWMKKGSDALLQGRP